MAAYHKAEFNGIAVTGKQFIISRISVARFASGKMVEDWGNRDALGSMPQLGIVQELGRTKAVAAVR